MRFRRVRPAEEATEAASRPKRRRRDRGAVMAEMFMITPLLLICAFSAVEIGSAYRDRLTVGTALRTSARVASNAGRAGSADWQTIVVMRTAIAEIPLANINRVVIYKADASGDPVDSSCLTTTVVAAGGVDNACNVYTAGELATSVATDFTADGAVSCAGNQDMKWCPLTRLPETDRVGVWVSIRHDYVTKFFPTSVTLTDRVIMQIEPEVN